MGTNLLSKLDQDLATLVREKNLSQDSPETKELKIVEGELVRLQEEIKAQHDDIIVKENALSRLNSKLAQVEHDFEKAGGTFYEQRNQVEKKFGLLKEELELITNAMLSEASKALPLSLVPNLLKKTLRQAQLEQKIKSAELASHFITTRDNKLLALIAEHSLDSKGIIASFLAQENEAREKLTKKDCYLNLPRNVLNQLEDLPSILEQEKRVAYKLVEEKERVESELTIINDKLSKTPSKDSIASILKAREIAHQEVQKHEIKLTQANNKLENLLGTQRHKEEIRSRLIKKSSYTKALTVVNDRTIRYAEKARETAKKFKQKLIENSLNQLEELILECIQQLLEKTDLITGVLIAPTTYKLELINSDNQPVSLESISAGERQLVIIAILWGLGKASGRPLPVIIDTPLARLDSSHRANLIERYFPHVSHQTIILSTDTEISTGTLNNLSEYIASSYRLKYNPTSKSTEISKGYF